MERSSTGHGATRNSQGSKFSSLGLHSPTSSSSSGCCLALTERDWRPEAKGTEQDGDGWKVDRERQILSGKAALKPHTNLSYLSNFLF